MVALLRPQAPSAVPQTEAVCLVWLLSNTNIPEKGQLAEDFTKEMMENSISSQSGIEPSLLSFLSEFAFGIPL